MRKFFTTGTILAVLATLLIFLSLGVAAAPVADLTSLNVDIGGSNLIDFRTTIPTYTVNINSTDILTVTANAGSGEEVSLDLVGESSGWQPGSASLIIASGQIGSGQDRNIMVSVREIASTTTKNYTITVHALYDIAEMLSNPTVSVDGTSINIEATPISGYSGQVIISSGGNVVFSVPNSIISNKGTLKSITPSSFSLSTVGATQDVVIILLSESGTEMAPYKYRVTRAAPSYNATLSDLTISPDTGSAGTWNTNFMPNKTSYTYTLPTGSAATSVTITPTVAEDEATVTVNDTSVTSGSGRSITLSSLSITTIKLVVTAPDGITATDYNITIIRERSKFFVPIGTPDPEGIPIYTAEDLDNVRNKLDGSYVLMNDIDLAEWGEWEPIGEAIEEYSGAAYDVDCLFRGSFDGQGHIIKNLTITGDTHRRHNGLFGYIHLAEIKNLGLENINIDIINSDINNNSYIGGIYGRGSYSDISNCYTSGSISFTFPAEIMTGDNEGIFDIYMEIGGICGENSSSKISNCYNQADISTLCNSSVYPYVPIVATADLGGICGESINSIISSCYNIGNLSAISGSQPSAGGLVGYCQTFFQNTIIRNCYNAGSIYAYSDNGASRAGGIYCHGSAHHSGSIIISNCYNAGRTFAKNTKYYAWAGGIESNTFASKSDVFEHHGYTEIKNCLTLSDEVFANAPSIEESYLIGCFSGNNFYKTNNLALENIAGNARDDSNGIISLTEAKNQTTYEALGWDFDNVWRMIEGLDYPQLRGSTAPFSPENRLSSLSISDGILSPAFNSVVFNYTTSVANDVSSITLLAEAFHPAATVIGTGSKNLVVGSNPFTVTVIAENGLARNYDIIITRTEGAGTGVGGGTGSAISYTVTFNSNGGSNVASQNISTEVKATKPANPTKDGFKFIGWFSDAALTKEYDFNATVSSSFTLYAKWKEIAWVEIETWQNPFTDVNTGNWFYENVKYVVTKSLFNGTGPTTFAPQSTMTRAMLFTVLARLAGVNTEGGATWYSLALDWAVKEGLTDGTNPQNPVTREQIVTILWRYAEKPAGEGSLKDFPDAASVSEWAVEAFEWAIGTGIINGSGGNLLPKGVATRAEVAAILHRFAELPK